jgi:hypothetical protein
LDVSKGLKRKAVLQYLLHSDLEQDRWLVVFWLNQDWGF